MIHPTSNGTEMVVQWAMQQIPESLPHNLAVPIQHLTRLLLCLRLGAQASADHGRKVQIPRGGNSRRTPRMGRHTPCIPFPKPTRLRRSHCRIHLTMQARKRSPHRVDRHQDFHPPGNTLSALLNTVTRVVNGHSLLHLQLIDRNFLVLPTRSFCSFTSYFATPHSFFFAAMLVVSTFRISNP